MRLIPVEYMKRFPASGNRRHLKGGMELPVFLLALWCGLMPTLAILQNLSLHRLWLFTIPIFLFLSISLVGRWMAAQDPYMTEIYLYALFYKRHYSALPRPIPVILIRFPRRRAA
jgi:type IV secretory pathway TrbD component